MLSLDCAPTSLSSCSSVRSHPLYFGLTPLFWNLRKFWACPLGKEKETPKLEILPDILMFSVARKTLSKVTAATEKNPLISKSIALWFWRFWEFSLMVVLRSTHSQIQEKRHMRSYKSVAPLFGWFCCSLCLGWLRGVTQRMAAFFPCTPQSSKVGFPSNHAGVLNRSTLRSLVLAQSPSFSSFQEE